MIIIGETKAEIKDNNLPMFSRSGKGTNNQYRVFQQKSPKREEREVSDGDFSDNSS